MYLPLGPCNLYFNEIDLGATLKEDDVSLEIKVKTEEIKTDESVETKEIIELGKDITFKASLMFSQETLDKLQVDKLLTSLVKEGELRIATLDKSITILLFKVKLILEPIFSFKSSKTNKIRLKAVALSNKRNKNIEIIFGVDVPNRLSVRIKGKNLMLYAPEEEKIPSFKIKNKKLMHSQNSGDPTFKISNGHLVKVLN